MPLVLLPLPLKRDDLIVDVFKLGIAIRMLASFTRLAIRLQAVSRFLEHSRHRTIGHGMILSGEFIGQFCGALAGPSQRGLRMPASHRVHQRLQCRQKFWIRFGKQLAPPARPTNAICNRLTGMRGPMFQLALPCFDRIPCQPCGLGDHRNSAPSQGSCLAGRPLPAQALVHHRTDRRELLPNRFDRLRIMHAGTVSKNRDPSKTDFIKLLFRCS